LLAVAYFTEWTRNAPKDGDTLETFKFVFYTGILYGSPLLYFCTSLFTQLDFIRLEATKLTSEVDRLKLESGRLEMSSSALSKPAGPGADKTMSNYDLYSRCLSELVHMRTVKDVPGFLFRNLSSGMNMQRGAIAVINEGTTKVIQAWGIPGDRGPSEIEVPDELIRMVQEKGGAVLEKEITGPGLHHEAVEWFAESAFEPVGMFPLTVRGKVLFLVFAGTSAEMGKALKVMPTLAITDITSQYVERFLRL